MLSHHSQEMEYLASLPSNSQDQTPEFMKEALKVTNLKQVAILPSMKIYTTEALLLYTITVS